MDRTKEANGLGKSIAFENFEEEAEKAEDEEVVRTKSIYLEPMTLDEAITRMEALGHTFFVYLDSDDEEISVAYKRFEGGYGVIQAENKLK
jgi:putative sigma-54 modulation protein